MSIEGQYTIPGVCIVALKGGMNNAVNQFVKWTVGTKKTLVNLKTQTQRLFEQGNTALQVQKIVKPNATKPQILRELFKVIVWISRIYIYVQ